MYPVFWKISLAKVDHLQSEKKIILGIDILIFTLLHSFSFCNIPLRAWTNQFNLFLPNFSGKVGVADIVYLGISKAFDAYLILYNNPLTEVD